MTSELAFEKLKTMDFNTVLDIGSGDGVHAEAFRILGKDVTTISMIEPADIIGDYTGISFASLRQWDCIWASHVLEHQMSVKDFLGNCSRDLKPNGILAITVPPYKPNIVGGHVTLWNAGLLLYNLIVAGFDCSEAMVKTYGYNITVIVRKKFADIDSLDLHYDKGDIEKLAHLFPMEVEQGFNGNIDEVNWK